jgi:ABC-2 type transport system permease protein
MNIVIKEIKELVRDPKILVSMIIVPVVMFPLMGFAIQTSTESAQQSIGKTSIAIIDQDQGTVSQSLENYLVSLNFTITNLNND